MDRSGDDTQRGTLRRADPLEVELARERTRGRLIGGEDRPVAVGRYRLLQRLGEGGMGTVYAALDPLLERNVAIKVVRGESLDDEDVRRLETRLVREAQALARLTEPNIVQLFEIGREPPVATSGRAAPTLYIVMELVDGVDFRRWVADARPSWREIVAAIVDAARGLAAAHDAGLVHRDIKPDNLLLARDGRVRVADFGLAAAMLDLADPTPATSSMRTLSRTPVGTPTYMAPEQIIGGRVDGRADQYSLSVTLHELLHGCPPGWTARGRVPAWIDRVIARGLSRRREDRYADMRTFAAALDPSSRWRIVRRVTPLAIAISIAVVLVATIEPGPRGACGSGEPWNDARRADLAAAFEATDTPYATQAAAAVTDDLDAWQRAWSEARAAVCKDTDGEPEHDPRWACLDRSRREVESLLTVFGDADPDLVAKAPDQSARVRDPGRCSAETTDPSAIAAAIEGALDRAAASMRLGRLAEAQAAIDPIVRDAMASEQDAMIARALLVRGQIRRRADDLADARSDLEHAYWIASEAGVSELAADAAIELATAMPRDGDEGEHALAWTRHAEAMAGAASPGQRQRLLTARGIVLEGLGRLDEAEQSFRTALTVAEQASDCTADCGSIHSAVFNLGLTLSRLGRESEAFPLLERALALEVARNGPEHPGVATSHQALGTMLLQRSRYEEACEHYRRALEIRERVLGPDHLHVANTLSALASCEQSLGDVASAEARLHRAIAIAERADADPAAMGVFKAALATHLQEKGELERALVLHREAIALFERSVGEHVWVATSLLNQANAHAELGDLVAAEAGYRRAIELRERVTGPQDADLALPLVGLGRLLVDTERGDEAVAWLERALTLVEDPGDPRSLEARFELARASWERAPERARALAGETLSYLHGDDPERSELRAAVVTWLDDH